MCPAVEQSVTEAFAGTVWLPGALQKGLRALGEAFPADGVFANTYYQDRKEVRFLALADREKAEASETVVSVPESVVAERRIMSSDPYLISNIEDDPLTHFVAPRLVPEIRSYVMVPVQLEGHHLGVVCFWSRRLDAFNVRHVEILTSLKTILSLNVGFALGALLEKRTSSLEAQNRELSESLQTMKDEPLRRLLANTPSMREFEPVIRQATEYDVPLLITGASGTGKEVVASTVHRMSSRAAGPFVRVNCSAVPEALLESEFFGSEAGAFTDAKRRRIGLFEEADGGTLFLDEIGELPMSMQAKLLHAVQDQTIRRVGSSREIRVNVHFIAATNRDLPTLIARQQFRLDLFYRLNVLSIRLKPLRERREDFLPLLKLFTQEVEGRFHVALPQDFAQQLAPQAEQTDWPGNVRELKNAVIRSALNWLQSGKDVRLVRDEEEPAEAVAAEGPFSKQLMMPVFHEQAGGNFSRNGRWLSFDALQKEYFSELLQYCKGKIAGMGGAAEIAEMHPNTLRSRLLKLGLAVSERTVMKKRGVPKVTLWRHDQHPQI